MQAYGFLCLALRDGFGSSLATAAGGSLDGFQELLGWLHCDGSADLHEFLGSPFQPVPLRKHKGLLDALQPGLGDNGVFLAVIGRQESIPDDGVTLGPGKYAGDDFAGVGDQRSFDDAMGTLNIDQVVLPRFVEG